MFADGGMRALVFIQPATQRLIVAFRGTDLNVTSASGQADSCADSILFYNKSRADLPRYCNKFSAEKLDYYTSAYNFTKSVLHLYPSYANVGGVLFTGHSLGAALALLMSASFKSLHLFNPDVNEEADAGLTVGAANKMATPAVVFSSPSVSSLIQTRVKMPPASINSSRTILLANKWDPVFASGNHSYPGAVCLWTPPEPLSCKECYKDKPYNPISPECGICFEKAHVFSKYVNLTESRVWPECSQAKRWG
jgi:hypothetical protein